MARVILKVITLASASFAIETEARAPFADSTDVRISPHKEAESAVFVSPLDPNVVLVHNNTLGGGDSATATVSAWVSSDAGRTWSDNLSDGAFGTDPGAAIIGNPAYSSIGRLIVMGFDNSSQGVRYKDAIADQWAGGPINPLKPTDKGHLWVDNSSFSPPALRYTTYAAWSDDAMKIDISKSVNGGQNWPLHANVPHLPGSMTNWGVNLQTGRNGRVYFVWGRFTGTPTAGTTNSFGFSEVTNHTTLEVAPEIILLNINDVGHVILPEQIMARSIPSMAVDKSDAALDRLFVVWADNTPATGPEILMLTGSASSGQSVVWDSQNLIKVNQSSNPDADQFWPWISWDECTDMLVVLYMELEGGLVNARLAASVDHGSTWTNDIQVSDVGWDAVGPDGYDYIGVAAGDGRAFPVWSDNRDHEGTDQVRPYVSSILLWGITSTSHSVEMLPGLIFKFVVTWTTNLSADADDELVLVPPPGIPLDGSLTITTSSDGKTHTAEYVAPCRTHHQYWNYPSAVSGRDVYSHAARLALFAFCIAWISDYESNIEALA